MTNEELFLRRLRAVLSLRLDEPPAAILPRARKALAMEMRRARRGHWAYDLNRHIALVQGVQGLQRMTGRTR